MQENEVFSMSKLLAIILGLCVIIPSSAEPVELGQAVVDRIEGDYAVVEFSNGETIEMLDILTEDINGEVSEGAEIPVISIGGKFYGDMICTDYKDIEDTYYQFKSDDDTVWWILTAKEIGHVPNTDDKYTLYYANNGTVEESRVCDCLPEWDCECYLYDDIFLYIEKEG